MLNETDKEMLRELIRGASVEGFLKGFVSCHEHDHTLVKSYINATGGEGGIYRAMTDTAEFAKTVLAPALAMRYRAQLAEGSLSPEMTFSPIIEDVQFETQEDGGVELVHDLPEDSNVVLFPHRNGGRP